MSLRQMIEELQAQSAANIPPDVLQKMARATRDLIGSGVADQALQPGERAPEFVLPNTRGEDIALATLLEQGPAVINFYRGAWCPYCNLELKALNDALPAMQGLGASLVSISPNLVEKSAAYAAANPFGFDLLCDLDNRVAKRYRLVFTLADELQSIYAGFGLDLSSFDGNTRFELPLPATYVVRPDGIVTAGFVHADYTRRMEPAAIIASLSEL
jgi:peroxiredoxin